MTASANRIRIRDRGRDRKPRRRPRQWTATWPEVSRNMISSVLFIWMRVDSWWANRCQGQASGRCATLDNNCLHQLWEAHEQHEGNHVLRAPQQNSRRPLGGSRSCRTLNRTRDSGSGAPQEYCGSGHSIGKLGARQPLRRSWQDRPRSDAPLANCLRLSQRGR